MKAPFGYQSFYLYLHSNEKFIFISGSVLFFFLLLLLWKDVGPCCDTYNKLGKRPQYLKGAFFLTMNSILPISAPSQTLKIAIQGVKGAFHEIAARKFFSNPIELDMCETFPQLFRDLENKRADIGVIAIENSVAGSLLPNYALLRDSHLSIIGEVYLRIKHNLMALPGVKLSDIAEIHSHPMALHQCQRFLGKHHHIKLVESEDTALSAKRIREHQLQNVGAIASHICAQYYELDILAEAIETNHRNFTRFLVVIEDSQAGAWVKDINKASLCFNLAKMSQRIGSLAGILSILGHYDMNLTKIQSLPILGKEWEYFFHIDLEFEDYERYQQSLDAIRPLVSEMKILGEYQRADKSNM